MFRVEFFVDDKRLAVALRNLAGVAMGSPSVVPVVNAVARGGKVTANGAGDLPDLFTQYLKTNKLTQLTPSQMKDFSREIGRSASSSTYIAKQLFKLGLISKTGKGPHTKYVVKKS